jgi:TRAP-type C4-dicarboxylate transport system permease small subunit
LPDSWSEAIFNWEVSRFLLIWIVFLGAVIAYIKSDHLGIDVLLLVLPPRIRRMVVILSDLLVLTALAIMFQGGWVMTADSLASGWVAASVPIPYGYVYMVGPISAALMFVQAIIKFVMDIKSLKEVQ